jgi:hypothetical protein
VTDPARSDEKLPQDLKYMRNRTARRRRKYCGDYDFDSNTNKSRRYRAAASGYIVGDEGEDGCVECGEKVESARLKTVYPKCVSVMRRGGH